MSNALLIVFLVTALAQIVPSCGGSEARLPGDALVIGAVEAKRILPPDHSYTIVVLSTEYEVSASFWQQVNVGDVVKWDGKTWTIVRRGR